MIPIATELEVDVNALKSNFFQKLWDEDAEFFKVLPQKENAVLQDVRELHGYTPWAFNLAGPQYAKAWKFLMSTRHFLAPYGLTTAEQCHPDFQVAYEGHECQWNGPSWPYATSMTLIGLANLLNEQEQDYVTARDYVMLLNLYARSQYRKSDNGEYIPWIDENLNPFTGDWISRSMLQQRDQMPKERGRDYNHSSFCDLVITGLIGLRPQVGDTLVVNPLLEDKQWDYFCLDRVYYHGKMITVMYDRTGKKYNKGVGLSIFVDGEKVVSSSVLKKVSCKL